MEQAPLKIDSTTTSHWTIGCQCSWQQWQDAQLPQQRLWQQGSTRCSLGTRLILTLHWVWIPWQQRFCGWLFRKSSGLQSGSASLLQHLHARRCLPSFRFCTLPLSDRFSTSKCASCKHRCSCSSCKCRDAVQLRARSRDRVSSIDVHGEGQSRQKVP